MYCSKCGTKAIDGAVFCQKCGAKLFQNNRDEQEPVSVPKQESEEMSNPAVKTISVSEQKSVKKENALFKGESVPALVSGPVKAATAPTESIMKTVQEADAHEESSATSGSDADIYALLKKNIDKYPIIKSAKQFKKCVRLRGKIYNHSVRLVTVHAVQARIRSLLVFPFSILYGVLAGLFCFTVGIILAELMKYGSICIEYYHDILFALCCLVMGAVVLIHSCVGCKEKAAVATYVREIVEPKRIYLSDRRRAGAIRIRVAVAVVLVAAGIIALPFSIPDPIEYPDELLFDGLPAARFLEMTQEEVESEFGKASFTGQSMITVDDYYNYAHDGFNHVTYSKETGKVIYIQFDAIYCSCNGKKLNKSLERVLDILSEGYPGGYYSFGVYGSIHNGFYYDSVYFGERLSVEEYLAQQEFEDSNEFNYYYTSLNAYGEEYYDPSWLLNMRERQDYKIDLIAVAHKIKDDLNRVYYVCLYTDEWLETVNATDVPLDQTIMDSNTSTSGETADDSVFGEALMQLIMYNTLPDGSVANDLDGKVNGIYDRFAICDIDQDGEKELLVNIASGSMSAAGIHIYGVNATRTGLDYVWSFETDVTFYDTGFVKKKMVT